MFNKFVYTINHLMLATGEEQVGEYVGQRDAEGLFHGVGILTWADGDVYAGDWVRGKQEGRARNHYGGDDVFEGEFRAGKAEGRGMYLFADGSARVGTYLAGKQVGVGLVWSADRKTAVKLLDDEPVGSISCDEARAVAGCLGLQVPPMQPAHEPAAGVRRKPQLPSSMEMAM